MEVLVLNVYNPLIRQTLAACLVGIEGVLDQDTQLAYLDLGMNCHKEHFLEVGIADDYNSDTVGFDSTHNFVGSNYRSCTDCTVQSFQAVGVELRIAADDKLAESVAAHVVLHLWLYHASLTLSLWILSCSASVELAYPFHIHVEIALIPNYSRHHIHLNVQAADKDIDEHCWVVNVSVIHVLPLVVTFLAIPFR